MRTMSTTTTVVSYMVLMSMAAVSVVRSATLNVGFYNRSCPSAEQIVRRTVANAFAANPGIAAGLIRMHFHDCFVRGCDASVLLDSTPGNPAEKEAVTNNPSLRGFDVIDTAKAAIERQCPQTVSCADIIAFAARDSAALAGYISYQVPAGRRDGSISIAAEADTILPSPFSNASELIANFASKNLTNDEMVTLSGAHSIGVAHCAAFTNRLYNFSATSQEDPTLDSTYAQHLKSICPMNSTPTDPIVVELDVLTPNVLDNMYYVGLQYELGLLTSDQALMSDPSLARMVNRNAYNPTGWATKFALAMVKMGQIEVLTGTQGEIRKNCSVINGGGSTSLFDHLISSDLASS